MEFSLDRLPPGAVAVVTGVHCGAALQAHLAQMGLVAGTSVTCRYRSPDRQVAALFLRGTMLAIRRRDLAGITVRPWP